MDDKQEQVEMVIVRVPSLALSEEGLLGSDHHHHNDQSSSSSGISINYL